MSSVKLLTRFTGFMPEHCHAWKYRIQLGIGCLGNIFSEAGFGQCRIMLKGRITEILRFEVHS